MSNRAYTLSTNVRTDFFIETCYSCGVPFGIPTDLQANLVQNRHRFFCPNGHGQNYTGKTDAEKLAEAQQQIERERIRLQQVRDQRDASERSNTALRGVVTRKTKQLTRVTNGVCPCCNRSFQNLGRHMAGQHPDFQEASK